MFSFELFYVVDGKKSFYAGENAFGFWFINLVDRTKSVVLLADKDTVKVYVEPTDSIPSLPSIITPKAGKKHVD